MRKPTPKSSGGRSVSQDNQPVATEPGSGHSGDAALRGKTRLTMYLDMAVVEYFRSRAGGRGYQTLINKALKQAIEQENLEDVLRRVIREEARPYQIGKGKT